MRGIKYNNPYPLRRTTIEDGEREHPRGEKYFCRVHTVYTEVGIVVVLEMDWAHNFGSDRITEFKTVFNGMVYSGSLAEQRLSDRQIKWLATHFMKNCVLKTHRLI